MADKDEKTQVMPARDIRLAYALEELFESALAAAGRDYVTFARSERETGQNGRGERLLRLFLI